MEDTLATGFRNAVWGVLTGNGVVSLVASSSSAVVVLERLARAAGSTEWFVCHSVSQLRLAASEFREGSCVSFYADSRIRAARLCRGHESELLGIIAATGDLVLGTLDPDEIHLSMDVVSGASELEQFCAGAEATEYWYGAFPGRDNDGVAAITVLLPDRDGVVRRHPH